MDNCTVPTMPTALQDMQIYSKWIEYQSQTQ